MICNHCGIQNDESAKYCSNCGSSFINEEKDVTKQATSPKSDNSTEYYEAAVGYKKVDYYLNKFKHYDDSGTSVSWNWSAFFVSFYWLLYRKMWFLALLYFLLPITVGIMQAILSQISSVAVNLLNLLFLAGIFVIFPMYANGLYYRHVKRNIKKAINYTSDEDKRLRMIAADGGTSAVALIVVIIFLFIPIIGILAAITIPAYHDYTIRARIIEGLTISTPYQIGVSDYVLKNRKFPQSTIDLGITQDVHSKFVRNIGIENGMIIITFTGTSEIEGKSVVYKPSISNNNVVWECRGVDIQPKYLPSKCRE